MGHEHAPAWTTWGRAQVLWAAEDGASPPATTALPVKRATPVDSCHESQAHPGSSWLDTLWGQEQAVRTHR